MSKNTEAFLEALAAVHAGTPDVFLTSSKTRDGKREILGSIGGLIEAAA